MNIICNSCVGARLYELRHKQFNNPFMWNVIPYPDFRNLILNYDSIDFGRYGVSLFEQSEVNRVAQVMYDSLVRAYYIHYHQDDSYAVPTKKNIDIFSNDIISYTRDAIDRRVERMKSQPEPPIFLFETRSRNRFNAIYTNEHVSDFIKLKTPYQKILLVNQKEFKDYPEVEGNCRILYYEDKYPDVPPDTANMAGVVYSKFKEIID